MRRLSRDMQPSWGAFQTYGLPTVLAGALKVPCSSLRPSASGRGSLWTLVAVAPPRKHRYAHK
jgi:hypothetical protein